jgi:hypothetical protein
MKHYKFGGSNAGRTIQCPSWVALAENLPPAGESSYAAEGTALHICMEMMLEGEIDSPADLEGKDVGGVIIEPDLVARINTALAAWDAFCKEHHILDYELEQTFELTDDVGGTADVVAWSRDTVFICDWKFGQGVEVDANNSPQGMFYSMCAMHSRPELFENKEVAVVIIQPIDSRSDHETCKVWDVPPPVFKQFRTNLFDAIQYDGPAEYKMGEYCKFCPGAAVCPAKTGAAEKALRIGDGAAKNLASNVDLALQLEDWIKAVKQMGHEQLEQGTALKGFKLVAKRATRKWNDVEAAEKELRKLVRSTRGAHNLKASDILTPAKLLTPPQVEKVMKAKKLDFDRVGDYISSQSSGNTLARESDKRPAILSTDALRKALGRTK